MWISENEYFYEIPRGWPYLSEGEERAKLPMEVSQLRNGNFWLRNANVFEFEGQSYSLILAVDGKRKSLDGYPQLGRQRKSNCGITLSSQRGVFLSSHGVKICSYNKIFEHPMLQKFTILLDGTDHFVFMIDGDFDLITSRNKLAEKSLEILDNINFINEILIFLEYVYAQKNHLLKQLLQRLIGEKTDYNLEIATRKHEETKDSVINKRKRFHVDILSEERWFVEPIRGEEHFVGSLYTFFAHIIPFSNPLYSFWKRPLTFSGVGIDAIALDNENRGFREDNLIHLEYKYSFSINEDFNHPLSIVDIIICWIFEEEIQIGEIFNDGEYDHFGQVEEVIEKDGIKIGFII